MKIFTFLITLICLASGRLWAQEYLLPATGTATYTTCGGTLYDDGGASYAYDSNANGSVTLRPATAGAKLRLDFSYLELDTVNTALYIYDGPDTKSPLIGILYAGRPTVYATGSTGALTVWFYSAGYPLRGFAAAISCVTTPPPLPDLAVLSVPLSVGLVPAGDEFSASARVSNLVGGLASFRLRYLLSTDTNADAGDAELSSSTNNLVAGTSGSYWQRLKIPASTTPGRYYVLAVAQLLNPSQEVSTANNVAITPLSVPALSATPDVTITALTVNPITPLTGGGVGSTTALYQNLGQPLAQSTEVGYYLSADAQFSPDDRLVGKILPEQPTTGRSSMLYQSIRIPFGTAPGAYYLLCVADHFDRVIEANEQNNVLATPLTIVPATVDLTFAKLRSALPGQVGAGAPLTVSGAVQTNGSISVDTASVGYYLSTDRELSSDDVLLGHDIVGPIYTGTSYYSRFTSTVAIPPTTPLGRYYVLLIADYRQEVAETNETNNVAVLPVDVVVPNVDLVLTAPRNGSGFPPAVGSTFYSRCTLANQGTTTAYPATIGYYLSADAQLSTDDRLVSQTQLLPIPGAASQVVETQFQLPATIASGAYYLLLVADYMSQVTETNETNNIATLPLQVTKPVVDLELAGDFSVLPARTSAGTTVNVSCYLNNLGTTPAPGLAVGYYLSADNLLSADDIYLGGYLDGRNLAYPNSPRYLTGVANVPRTAAPGRYYLLGVADPQNEFDETDETNNVRYASLDITSPLPDLKLVDTPYLAAQQAAAGSTVDTESYVSNLGATNASASRVGYYLSTVPMLSPDALLLGSTATGAVPLGQSVIVPGSLTVPTTTRGGRYYVLFVADYLAQLSEQTRANNVAYTTITVTNTLAAREQLAGAELLVAPVPVASGASLHVQLTNPARSAEATLGLYNSLGQLVATRSLTLLPGRSNQAELPTAGLAAGVYVMRLTGSDLSATRRVVIE